MQAPKLTPVSLLTLGLALGALAAPASAQGSGYLSDSMTTQGDPIEVVQVPRGSGDGVISERDVVCLAEFTTWAFDRVIQSVDPKLAMPANATENAVTLWASVWPGLDAGTKAEFSQMDVLWPNIRREWAHETAAQRSKTVGDLRALLVDFWGNQIGPAASFLAGEISESQFTPSSYLIMARWQGGAGGYSPEPYQGGGYQPTGTDYNPGYDYQAGGYDGGEVDYGAYGDEVNQYFDGGNEDYSGGQENSGDTGSGDGSLSMAADNLQNYWGDAELTSPSE